MSGFVCVLIHQYANTTYITHTHMSLQVVKTVVRRGAAYARVTKIDEAIADYTLAAGLDPKNETLRSDLNKILNYRQGLRDAGKKANESISV